MSCESATASWITLHPWKQWLLNVIEQLIKLWVRLGGQFWIYLQSYCAVHEKSNLINELICDVTSRNLVAGY